MYSQTLCCRSKIMAESRSICSFSTKLWKSETIFKRNLYKDELLKHLVLVLLLVDTGQVSVIILYASVGT
jgi:hypothetical protein